MSDFKKRMEDAKTDDERLAIAFESATPPAPESERCPQCGKREWLGHAGSCPTLKDATTPPAEAVREWWIQWTEKFEPNNPLGRVYNVMRMVTNYAFEGGIPVIERSAYERVVRELADLKDADEIRRANSQSELDRRAEIIDRERARSAKLLEALNKISGLSPFDTIAKSVFLASEAIAEWEGEK